MEVSLIVVSSLADLNTARLLFSAGHFEFAFATLVVSLYCMFLEVGTWRTLPIEVRKSIKLGYLTDGLHELFASERRLEGLLDLALAAYTLPWAVHSNLDLLVQTAAMLLSVFG